MHLVLALMAFACMVGIIYWLVIILLGWSLSP